MAISVKTIEYAWSSSLERLTAGTPYTSSTLYVAFPETGSDRKFQSAWLEVAFRDTNAATTGRGSINTQRYALVMDGVSTSTLDRAITAPNADTGEQTSYLFTYDCLNHFQAVSTDATGSNVAFSWYYTSSASDPRFTNIFGKLFLTYEYNTLNDRRVKTVTIPIEKTGSVLSTLTEIPSPGNPQVPLLDSFCPEANKTFRNIWFEVEGTEFSNATATQTLSMSLDNEAVTPISFHELANGVCQAMKVGWSRNDMDTSTTHSVNMQMNLTTGNFNPVSVTLKATYEYDHSASTTILNSIQLPFMASPDSYADPYNLAFFLGDFFVEEPEPIDHKQSGLQCIYGYTSTGVGLSLQLLTGSLLPLVGSIGSQPPFYTRTVRCDASGSISDSRLSVQRGLNSYGFKYMGTGFSVNRASGIHGYYLLNYHSAKHPNGDHVHNHTIRRLMVSGSLHGTVGQRREVTNNTASIPENLYYLNAFGITNIFNWQSSGRANILTFAPAIGSNDFGIDPKLPLAISASVVNFEQPLHAQGASEHNFGMAVYADNRYVRKYPSQIVNRYKGVVNFQANHSMSVADAVFNQLIDSVTYHTITYTITGSLTGVTDAGIPLGLYRSDTKELITTGSTSAGGGYSFTWYDNTIPVFIEALSGSTKAGRSIDYYAQM